LKRNLSPKQALQSKFANNTNPKKSPHTVKKLPAISTPEISVPCPKHPTTHPRPERDQSSPRPPMLFNIHFNSILPSTPRSSKWSFSFTFPPPKPYMYFPFFPNVPHVLPILSRPPRNIV